MTENAVPTRITFRHMDPSPAVEARIRESADKLASFHQRITGCTVVVEARDPHRHRGNHFKVHIDLAVPGAELAVSRDGGLDDGHEDVYVAIRDAFDAARRRLQDHAQRSSAA